MDLVLSSGVVIYDALFVEIPRGVGEVGEHLLNVETRVQQRTRRVHQQLGVRHVEEPAVVERVHVLPVTRFLGQNLAETVRKCKEKGNSRPRYLSTP